MLGPLYWLAHNWLIYSNALEFFNGPYSALTIYRQTLAQNMAPYPRRSRLAQDWLFYFCTAARLCAGWGAVAVASAGLIAALWKRMFWPHLCSLRCFRPLLPVEHALGRHAHLRSPACGLSSYYNTRYGLAALPLLADRGRLPGSNRQ